MVYTGVIVLEPKQQHSYHGRQPETDDEYFEMTLAETDEIIRKARGVPIHVEHLGEPTRVGQVIEAGYDVNRRVCVRFELDTSADARIVRNWIQAGFLRGLSLAHVRETSQPVEISLCFRGARPGTGIIAYDAPSETTGGARKQSPATLVQPAKHSIVQASASMDANPASAAASSPPPLPAAAAAAALPITGPGANLGAYLIPPRNAKKETGRGGGVASLDTSPNASGETAAPVDAPADDASDAEIEQQAMAKILEDSGLSERQKQKVLSGLIHNKAILKQVTEHAAKLARDLESTKATLEQEQRSKGDLTATQIQMVARMVAAMSGPESIPESLQKRVDNAHSDPTGVWNSMLPVVVQASAAAMRYREEAQKRVESVQTQAMYQQYLRSTGWQPSLAQQPQQSATHATQLASTPAQQQQQHVVEASRVANRHTAAAAAAPALHAERELDPYEQMRAQVFKRKIADPFSEVPKMAPTKPYDSFSEVRRMLGTAVPTMQYAGMQQ
jgi:hypothetical protein